MGDRTPAGGRPFSKGGFSGLLRCAVAAAARRGRTAGGRLTVNALRPERPRANNGCRGDDNDDTVWTAVAPVDGLERERAKRVRVAFDRILDRGWIGVSEQDLTPHEMAHVNAVREHYALRRDLLLTPSCSAGPGSNVIEVGEWVANASALNASSCNTGVQDGFLALVQQRAEERMRRERMLRRR
ncbi:hypothetical protein DQ04_03291040 [Trypanosoma grayi]|uniref:hypothetical protein n=1 Tax=Trypanosoma grayi TaxID=71804 RepID=UPI0004F4416D|nr:hypothetical protein DQ04_03291040 [Trypanosoma grayi]KEG10787.1 hypothetical protein DQ04_03291040 [Trypanosoma grayi]